MPDILCCLIAFIIFCEYMLNLNFMAALHFINLLGHMQRKIENVVILKNTCFGNYRGKEVNFTSKEGEV